MSAPSDGSTRRAVLTARRDAGGGVNLITLTPAVDVAPGYRAPGQYIQVHAEGGGYFAFAGDVGAPSWELLVRNAGGASDALTNAPEGTTFDISGPLGAGFPLDRARGRPLTIAVVGSALAVARPVLRARIAEGLEGERHSPDGAARGASTTVYIGVRTPRDLPLTNEVAGWARAGVRVVLCLSRPDLDEPDILPEAVRRTGWVQAVLAADIARGNLDGIIFAAGPFAMLEEIGRLGRAGAVVGATLEVWTNV